MGTTRSNIATSKPIGTAIAIAITEVTIVP